MNMVHDITYRYGFTEKAFNFQMSNFGRGGRENDGIVMSVNNKTRENDATFFTPPECVPTFLFKMFFYLNTTTSGQPGECYLYLFKHIVGCPQFLSS